MPDFKRNETFIRDSESNDNISQQEYLSSFQSQMSKFEYQRLCMISQYYQYNQINAVQNRNFSKYSQITNQEEYLYQIYKCQQALLDPKYKTELCKSFISEGFCRYNFKCRFAHGIQDLNSKSRDNSQRGSTDKEKIEKEPTEIDKDDTFYSSASISVELNRSINEESQLISELSPRLEMNTLVINESEEYILRQPESQKEKAQEPFDSSQHDKTSSLFKEFNKLDTNHTNGLYFIRLKNRLPVFKKFSDNTISRISSSKLS